MAVGHNALPLRRFGPSASAPRAVRGGGWNNPASNARAGYRNRNEPDNRNNNQGFRVVVCCHKRSPGAASWQACHGSSASASRGLAEPAGGRMARGGRVCRPGVAPSRLGVYSNGLHPAPPRAVPVQPPFQRRRQPPSKRPMWPVSSLACASWPSFNQCQRHARCRYWRS